MPGRLTEEPQDTSIKDAIKQVRSTRRSTIPDSDEGEERSSSGGTTDDRAGSSPAESQPSSATSSSPFVQQQQQLEQPVATNRKDATPSDILMGGTSTPSPLSSGQGSAAGPGAKKFILKLHGPRKRSRSSSRSSEDESRPAKAARMAIAEGSPAGSNTGNGLVASRSAEDGLRTPTHAMSRNLSQESNTSQASTSTNGQRRLRIWVSPRRMPELGATREAIETTSLGVQQTDVATAAVEASVRRTPPPMRSSAEPFMGREEAQTSTFEPRRLRTRNKPVEAPPPAPVPEARSTPPKARKSPQKSTIGANAAADNTKSPPKSPQSLKPTITASSGPRRSTRGTTMRSSAAAQAPQTPPPFCSTPMQELEPDLRRLLTQDPTLTLLHHLASLKVEKTTQLPLSDCDELLRAVVRYGHTELLRMANGHNNAQNNLLLLQHHHNHSDGAPLHSNGPSTRHSPSAPGPIDVPVTFSSLRPLPPPPVLSANRLTMCIRQAVWYIARTRGVPEKKVEQDYQRARQLVAAAARRAVGGGAGASMLTSETGGAGGERPEEAVPYYSPTGAIAAVPTPAPTPVEAGQG